MTISVTRRRVRRLAAAAVLIFAIGAGLAPQPARAQQDAAPGTAASDAQVISYEIPAGPLAPALNRLAREAGLVLAFDPELARGKRTAGLDGQFTPQHALERLLAGTGLGYRITEQNQLVIAPLPDNKREEALLLEPIQVAGEGLGGFRADSSSSATNVNARLIETPATVNVLTRDFLDTVKQRRLEDVLQFVPGIGTEQGETSTSAFNIRGFSANTLSFSGGTVFVDDYRAPGRRYHFDDSLYERIDILKGTSGVLYGTAPPGGIVRYVSKRPEFESRHRLESTLGSFETARGTIDSTGPLNDDKTLAYRLIATGSTFNQTVHGESDDVSFDDRLIVKPAIRWLTPTGGDLYVGYEYSHHENAFDPGVARLNGDFLFRGEPLLGSQSFAERDNHVVVAEVTQPLADNWEVFLGGSYNRTDIEFLLDRANQDRGGDPNLFQRFTRLRTDHGQDQSEIRGEIRGRFSTGELIEHQVTLGGNWYEAEESGSEQSQIATNDAIDPRNPVFSPIDISPSRNIAVSLNEETKFYLQDFISIGQKLNVFGGLAYTDAKIESSFPDFDFTSAGEEEALDWSIGAVYNQSHWLNPFVSYSTSLTPQRGVLADGGLTPFREGEQLDIGLKSEWLGGRLATTASLFEIEQTNIAEGDPNNPDFSILIGDQRTRGFEFEAAGSITDQISIIGGYSYLDAEFTRSLEGNEGNTPHSVPKHKLSVFGQYALTGDLEGWSAGIGFLHVGERQGNNENTFELPTYERVDLNITYERGPFDFQARVENVFDEDYIVGSNGRTDTFAQGAPRFFTLSVGYDF